MIRRNAGLIVALLASLPAAALAQAGASPFPGRWEWELRPRWNHIEETGRPLATDGGTARATAAWHSAPWHGWRFTLEGIAAAHFGAERFNDDPARFLESPYPLLPDPEHVGLNRAHVDFESASGWAVRAGRQRLQLDDGRWVSDNDFRQIPQLLDGVALALTPASATRILAGHYRGLRDTSGERERVRLTVLHGAWNPAPGHALSAYAYFHDQPQTAHFTGFADNSQRALGVRAQGVAWRRGAIHVPYVAEYAVQKPYAGGDARIDARYWRLGAGVAARDWTIRADVETRGSNAGRYGLQMPLTDFYAFNGWTLRFFTVPPEGLRDRWMTLRRVVGPVTVYAEAHRFRSDFGGTGLGRENDVGLAWSILPQATLRLQHARYDPGRDGAPEIRKTWLTLTWRP